ncbi:MAG TPA: extracellular solute-binding protein [Candidatus Lustribacter sp.]|jgi:iron(III) transport system substrate-binding protein|nr:extracellular solute-binding protein [Candidatus Lustribacter sp.]
MKRSDFVGTAAGAALGLAGMPGHASGATLTWPQLLAAARKEGTVDVAGPADPGIRAALADGFQRATGISVSYEGLEPNILDARVDREGTAGKPTIDVLVGGSSELLQIVPKGLLAPVRPILCIPEVTDRNKWADDRLLFTDEQGVLLFRTVSSVYGGVLINTKNVSLTALKTSGDLLRPEYTGKIISSPYASGSGAGFASNVLYRLQLDYFTKLYKGQNVSFIPTSRGVVEAVARGTHLLGFGTFPYEIEEFKKQGFPLDVVSPRDLPGYVSASNGTVKLVKNCPHPNAGAAFINWFGTREGQNRMSAATLDPSRRKDADRSLVPAYMIPKPGVDYLDQHTYTFYTSLRPQVIAAVSNILGK